MPTNSLVVGVDEVRLVPVNRARTSLIIFNTHSLNTVYIRDGGSGVSTTNGIPIASNGFVSFKIPEDDPTSSFFAIADAVNTRVTWLEQLGQQPLPVRVS